MAGPRPVTGVVAARRFWSPTALAVFNAGLCISAAAAEGSLDPPPQEADQHGSLRGGRTLLTAVNDTSANSSTPQPVAQPQAPAAEEETDLLLIILPSVGGSLALLGLCVGAYCLSFRRRRNSQRQFADLITLDQMEQDYEVDMLRLAKNIELFSSKFDALPEDEPNKMRHKVKHTDFLDRWVAFQQDSKRFLDQEYTPEFHKRADPAGSTTVSGVSMRQIDRGPQKEKGLWPKLPVTPAKETGRQLKVLRALNERLRKLFVDFQELRDRVAPEGVEALQSMAVPQPLPEDNAALDPKLEEEVDLIRPFAHPLLGTMAVKPYDVLGVAEGAAKPKPHTPIGAVVVDSAGWSNIGQKNNPKGASGASLHIYEWLGITVANAQFPPEVHSHFSASQEEADKRAHFHCYERGAYVVHVINPKIHEVLGSLYDLSHAYLNLFTEFCRVTEGGSPAAREAGEPVPKVLRLTPFSVSQPQLGNRKLERHMAEVTWSAMCMAFAMMPPALHAQLRDTSIEVCVAKKKDLKLYEEALDKRKALVSSAPKISNDLGCVERRFGTFDWVRHKNAPADRLQRLNAMLMTQQAVCSGSYVLSNGSTVSLHPKDMFNSTRLKIAPNPHPTPQAPRAKITHGGSAVTVMEAAIEAHSSGRKTVAVNAASAYSVGGGVLTGGRHALEETWCMVSTLLGSLQTVQWEQLQVRRSRLQPGVNPLTESLPQHIPVDGCIVSPGVEIFRDTSAKGYAFHDSGTKILGVCSIAMFNMNPRVRDSPQDAPRDFHEYCRQVKQKFRAMIAACDELGAEVLICPDVGCGVFANDPQIVGSLFGEALRESKSKLDEIVITGKERFYSSASTRAQGGTVEYDRPLYFDATSSPKSSGGSPPAAEPSQVPASKPGDLPVGDTEVPDNPSTTAAASPPPAAAKAEQAPPPDAAGEAAGKAAPKQPPKKASGCLCCVSANASDPAKSSSKASSPKSPPPKSSAAATPAGAPPAKEPAKPPASPPAKAKEPAKAPAGPAAAKAPEPAKSAPAKAPEPAKPPPAKAPASAKPSPPAKAP